MAKSRTTHLDDLEEPPDGAKRIALFRRNVGKTTLLAMFYRQASTGQVPGLRLAAETRRCGNISPRKSAKSSPVSPPPALPRRNCG